MVSLSNVIKVTWSIVLYPLEGGALKFNFKRSDAHRFQVQVVCILYMFKQSTHFIGSWKLATFSVNLYLSCKIFLHSGLDNSAFMVPMSKGKDNPTEKGQHAGRILISSPCNRRVFVYSFCLINICLSLSDEANKIKPLNIERA